jgi:hypothetical protein
MKIIQKSAILWLMNTKKIFSSLLVLIVFSGCALVTDEYQANQRKVIAYLLEDLPIPEDAEVIKAPTVLLVTGEFNFLWDRNIIYWMAANFI